MYLFWSIVAGILCGAGFIPLVVIGSIVIGAVIVLFANKIVVENPYLLVVKLEEDFAGDEVEKLIKSKSKKFALKSKSIIQDYEIEATYEVRVKENDAKIVSEVSNIPGVRSAVMLSYDGNFTA